MGGVIVLIGLVAVIVVIWKISASVAENNRKMAAKNREYKKYGATCAVPASRGAGVSTAAKYPTRETTEGGYIRVKAPDHPITTKNGWVGMHRVLMYDHLGPGPHKCYWCARTVVWQNVPEGPQYELIQVDHLNAQRSDNKLSNLVLSCAKCNVDRSPGQYGLRGKERARKEYMRRVHGI